MTRSRAAGVGEVIILSTAPKMAEAKKIANFLVNVRLIACANILPKIRSIYRWQGKVHDEPEVLIVMKSLVSKVPAIKRELKKLHSYDCPEFVVIKIADGLPDYLKWINECVSLR